MIQLTTAQLQEVHDILNQHLPSATVHIFGSRANGSARAGSDLDLLINLGRRITIAELAELKNAFDESDLPFKVDLVDAYSVADGFLREVGKEPMFQL